MGRKSLHITLALVAAVISVGLVCYYSDLTKDPPTTFATVSGLATLYGVAFAILEVIRARSAASLAAVEASRAAASVSTLYGLGALSECQSCIEYALEGIDKDGQVLSSPLSRIMKLYIEEFHREYLDERSAQRENVSIVQSYASLQQPNRPAHKVKKALMAMMADISASASKKKSGATTQ